MLSLTRDHDEGNTQTSSSTQAHISHSSSDRVRQESRCSGHTIAASQELPVCPSVAPETDAGSESVAHGHDYGVSVQSTARIGPPTGPERGLLSRCCL